MTMSKPRVRRSLTDIQADYDRGDTTSLETLMRAWQGIQKLPVDDPNSFFRLGGFHGEPFRGQGSSSSAWWGGYCQHGTVLFPTWHRAYMSKLEKALQSIPGCAEVMLPFWDECSDISKANGIPSALTAKKFKLDGVWIDNPLRSFTLPVDIVDQVTADSGTDPNSPNYSKPAGYETVRYPLSGLVGTPSDRAATQQHNAAFPSYAANVLTLDANIMTWLTMPVAGSKDGQPYMRGLIDQKFHDCMNAPTYTLFSNTTSATAWGLANSGKVPVVPLESAHNYIHLAVGGYDIPVYDASPIAGANADMGENDTAALDPIFYFHHCFIDYAFWTWQRRHGTTTALAIDSNDPGASYAGGPPPAGANMGDILTMQTPLLPFMHEDGQPFTSVDCVDIESQLGYTYGPGSLDGYADLPINNLQFAAVPDEPTKHIHVRGIDRTQIAGSFIVAAYVEEDGVHRLVGTDAVLSRWNVSGCANCQTKLRVSSNFQVPASEIEDRPIKIVIHSRHGTLGDVPVPPHALGQVNAGAAPPLTRTTALFTVDIR